MGIGLGGFIKAVFLGFAKGAAPSLLLKLGVTLARIGVMVLVAKITTPKLDLSDIAHEKLVTIRDSVAPQKFIYGEDMVSGPVIYANLGADGTTTNDDLYQLVALTGHEVDDFVKYRVDDEDILLSDVSGPKDGTVDSGKYAGVAEVDIALGTSGQAALSLLSTPFPGTWTTAHTARGWAIMCWKFSLVDGLETAWESGVPRNLKALLRGYRVYDPRLDGSIPNGTGLHRVADPTTWEWSDNPALCLGHFILDTKFGMREDATRVDWQMVQTAADICDATVVIPTASTQARYTCNATFLSTEKRKDVRDTLLGAMMGRMVFSQGLWKMWAGAAITPDVTLTEANLAGEIQLQASAGATERYNIVRGKFVDADRGYLANPYITQKSSVYLADDGGEEREIVADMLHTNNEYEAQRKAIIFLKQSRNQRIVAFQGNFSCFRIQPGATVLLDIAEYGFAGEKFFVTEWAFSEEGIQLTLVEEDDTAWADPIEGDYSTRSSTGVITSVGTGIPAPSSLIATSAPNAVLVSWANPTAQLFDHIEIWASDDNVRANALLIGTTQGTNFFEPLADNNRIRFYWVRAIDSVGRISTWEPDLTTTTATAGAAALTPGQVLDPDFDLSIAALPELYWSFNVKNATSGSGAAITLQIGGGANSSNAMRLHPSQGTGTGAVVDISNNTRFRMNAAQLELRIRYKSTVAIGISGLDGFFVDLAGWTAQTGGSFSGGGTTYYDLPSTAGAWETLRLVADISASDAAQYWDMRVGIFGVLLGPVDIDIDSIFVNLIGGAFGDSVNESVVQGGSVPFANEVTDVGKVLKSDGTWANNPGGQTDTPYTFDTTITSGDPGVGEVRFDNATLASVTNLYINDADNVGINMNPMLGFMAAGNRIYFEVVGDPTKAAIFEVSGALTDNTGWWTIPVTVVASDTLPAAADALSIMMDFNVSGAGGGDVTASGTPLNNEVAVFTGLTDIDSDATFTYDGTTLEATQFAGIAKANLLDKSLGETITLPTNARWEFTGDGTGQVRLSSGTDLRVMSDDDTNYFILNYNNSDCRISNFGTDVNTQSFYMNGFLDLKLDFPIHIKEQVAADAFKLGYGQIWVKTVTPNELWFTDDAGTDVQLGVSSSGTVGGTGTDNFLAVWNGTADIDAGGSFLVTNAVDKTAAETITGEWNFDAVQIDFLTGTQIRIWEAAGVDSLLIRDSGINAVYSRVNGIHTFSQGVTVTGDIAGTNLSGTNTGDNAGVTGVGVNNQIAVWNGTGAIDAGGSFDIANAVDKTVTETIAGLWIFSANLRAAAGIDVHSTAAITPTTIPTALPLGISAEYSNDAAWPDGSWNHIYAFNTSSTRTFQFAVPDVVSDVSGFWYRTNNAAGDGWEAWNRLSVVGHTHLLAAGATDVTATAAEVNLLDLAALTAGWILSADSATTASWKALDVVDWEVTGAELLHADRFGAGANFADTLVSRPHISDFAIQHQSVAAIAATVINYSLGQSIALTLGAVNVTSTTINNWPITGRLGQLQLEVIQGGTPRTIVWPAAVTWVSGVAPDLTTASETYMIHLSTRDAGTTIIGSYAADSSPGVDSVFGRSGTVVAQQSDYDSFFLTPTEGNALYSLLAHEHTTFDRALSVLSGAVVFSNITVLNGIVTAIATRSLDHDALTGFVSQEHIRWDLTGAEDIHADRMSSGANMAASVLDSPHISDFSIEHQVVTGVASTTINYLSGQSVLLNLSAANITTLTVSNWPATGRLGQLEIEITQSTTARTIAWDTLLGGTVKWPNGTEPDLAVANGTMLVSLRTRDAGTSIIGTFAEALS